MVEQILTNRGEVAMIFKLKAMSEILSIIIEKILYKFCNFNELDDIKIEITEEEIINQLTSFNYFNLHKSD